LPPSLPLGGLILSRLCPVQVDPEPRYGTYVKQMAPYRFGKAHFAFMYVPEL